MASNNDVRTQEKKSIDSFYWEESHVKLRDATTDLTEFRRHCSAMRDFLQSSLASKKNQEKLNWSTFASHLISIKELNRKAQFRIRKARASTEEQKLDIEKSHLHLQNLLYEVAHLENEIKTCLELRSLHDKISLVSPEEFYRATGREPFSLSQHEETMERLYWELEQRKELSYSCDELKCALEAVFEEIRKKRNYLSSIVPRLKDVADTTLTTQEVLDLPFTQEEEQYESSFLLPTPLYLLYACVKSYITVSDGVGHMSVSINGDVELARVVNSSQIHSDASFKLNTTDLSDNEDAPEVKKRKVSRHKLKTDTSGDANETNANTEPELHPLSVVINFIFSTSEFGLTKDNSISLTLTFAWMPVVKLVTVRMCLQSDKDDFEPTSASGNDLLHSEILLSNLFHRDSILGSEKFSADVPILVPGHKTKSPITWNACSSVGRPYSWAQLLTGLHSFPVFSDAEKSSTSTVQDKQESSASFGQIESWFVTLRKRFAERIFLIHELAAIESGQPLLSAKQQAMLPSFWTDVRLVHWKRGTLNEFSSVQRSQSFLSLNLIQEDDAVFHCQLRHSDTHSAIVWVTLSSEYPHKAPILLIENSSIESGDLSGLDFDLSDLHLQELEAEVNCHWKEFFPSNEERSALDERLPERWDVNILSCQLARCAACLSMLFQNQSILMNSHPKNVKYPTRSRPMRYIPSTGVFVHR